MKQSNTVDAIWVAVNSHPNREHAAETHLRNQGYETYVPVLRKQIRHARQVRSVHRPFFPGYLFVRLAPPQMRWRPILSTIGVRTVVCMGDTPCIVPKAFIDDLKSREKEGVIMRPAITPQIGDAVHIGHGAFEGLAGKLIGLTESDRLIVLMNFLNRPVCVTVPSDLLSVA